MATNSAGECALWHRAITLFAHQVGYSPNAAARMKAGQVGGWDSPAGEFQDGDAYCQVPGLCRVPTAIARTFAQPALVPAGSELGGIRPVRC